MDGGQNDQGLDNTRHLDNATRAVHDKRSIPEIDFTLHTMEDGTQVSTQERVCKGKTHIVRLSSILFYTE